MNERVYKAVYANHPVNYSFLIPQTRYYFRDFIKEKNYSSNQHIIKVSEDLLIKGRELLPNAKNDAYIEFCLLISLTSKFLLKDRCCMFHSVSFIYRGYAWLLTAPSGTGKTTQYMNWLKIFPGEIEMISGDKPLLEIKEDNCVWVHPTPWNGKERIGNLKSAPLGGIIYLEQDNKNTVTEYPVKDGLLSLFNQFLVLPDTEEEIRCLTEIAEIIFSKYEVLLFKNTGDTNSTIMLRNAVGQMIENKRKV